MPDIRIPKEAVTVLPTQRSRVPEQPPPPIKADRMGDLTKSSSRPRQSRAVVVLLSAILLTLLVLTASYITVSMQSYADAHPRATVDFDRLSRNIDSYTATQTAEHNP